MQRFTYQYCSDVYYEAVDIQWKTLVAWLCVYV